MSQVYKKGLCSYYLTARFLYCICVRWKFLHFIATVQFTFTPVSNIEVYQSVHYRCSVDHTGVSISWLVNGTDSANSKIIKLGIVTNGAGSHNSSLTIPGYPQYNNTVVRCNAFGVVNGNSYFSFDEATLKIQGVLVNTNIFMILLYNVFLSGKLSKVKNLTCTRQGHCCINCSWSPPFSLEGVSIYGYIINVTNIGDNTQYTTTSNTTSWIYCPSQFGNYTVSIAGSNSAGEGNTTDQAVTLSNSKLHNSAYIKNSVSIVIISNYSVTTEKINGNWTTIFTIKVILYILI